MKNKENQVPTLIKEITMNEKTYENETFRPNLINYFYGKNGTGKSTISEHIKNTPPNKYELLVYNNDFIREEIQSYGNIPSLFTITKKNAEVSKEIDALNGEKRKRQEEIQKLENEKNKAIAQRNTVSKQLLEDVWNVTADIRGFYADALKGAGTKISLTNKIKGTEPVQHDEKELQTLFLRSFGPDDDRYVTFKKVPDLFYPEDILSTPIVSSGTTQFAKFVEELRLSDWLKTGHEKYQHISNGKCPYCQQMLPENFDSMVASCFDRSYQEQIENLNECARAYKQSAASVLQILEENIREITFPYMAEYIAFKKNIKTKLSTAVEMWDRKIKEPGATFKLPDITEDLKVLNACIDKINIEIKEHNDVIDNRKASQRKCTEMVWEQMAFICHDQIISTQAEEKTLLSIEATRDEEIRKISGKITEIDEEIKEKSKQTINTTGAKDSINQLIKDAGFQGFEIRDKKNAQYVYELVRKDGSVVQNLSEGETNFIGFLYFYNMVMNSQSDDGIQREKVVVIDDPVSSMDSGALFSVAALVRNLIEICYNNYDLDAEGSPDFIKQIICLTHNPFFFKEISYNHVSDYECVNFYELTKDEENHSHIKLCIEESGLVGGGYVNYSPIKNTYDALWAEYKTATNPTILMNVIRRILEYYFLQIGGYKGNNLRKDMLDKNKDCFPSRWEYDSAAAMIAYINTGSAGFDDGLYFDTNAITVDQMRSVCRNIFRALHQEQHYDHMMG